MRTLLPSLLALFHISLHLTPAQASSKVTLDLTRQVVTLSSTIYFYGPEASEAQAKETADKINIYWNGGDHKNSVSIPLKAKIRGVEYTIKMDAISNSSFGSHRFATNAKSTTRSKLYSRSQMRYRCG